MADIDVIVERCDICEREYSVALERTEYPVGPGCAPVTVIQVPPVVSCPHCAQAYALDEDEAVLRAADAARRMAS